jgi:hypothetical protein
LALGVGALALLIVGMASWDGFDQPTLSGHILIVGPAGLPPLAAGEDDVAAFSLCVPRGGTLFVHVLPFTRVLDARGACSPRPRTSMRYNLASASKSGPPRSRSPSRRRRSRR